MISLKTLGSLDLRDAKGRELRAVLQQPKRLALLVYLALEGGKRFHRRDTLLALFWPDLDTEHARAALRRALYFLRHEIGDDVIVNRGEDEVSLGDGAVNCDAAEFDALLLAAKPLEALALYGGDLLEGFYVSGAPEAERWLDSRRLTLRTKAAKAASSLAKAPGLEPAAAAELARRAAALSPDDEAGVRTLMSLLARSGDRTGALRAYEELARRLKDELDVEPEDETTALAETLRAAPATSRHAPRITGTPPAIVPGLLAVRPFTIHGDSKLDYLAEGMVDLLSTALNGAGDLRTTDPLSAVGAEYLLEGSVIAAAGKLRVAAQLKRADSGETITRAEAQADGEQNLFELVDDLVRQLITARIAGPGARLARLAAVTTSSLPALRVYLEGEQHTRAGRHFEAFGAYAQAVQLDDSFALAHYRLAGACAATAMLEQARAASARALEHKQRVTERDRLLLEAQFAWLHGHLADAERRYGTAVTMYPDDLEAWYLLGDAQFHGNPDRGRSIVDAREPLERALALDPFHSGALVKLARIAALEDRPDDVAALVEQALKASPDGDQVLAMRALRAYTTGDHAEQQALLEALPRARALPAVIAFGDVALYAGDLANADLLAHAFEAVARADELKALCLLVSAGLSVAAGKFSRLREILGRAHALAPAWTLELRGLFAIMPFTPQTLAENDELRAALEGWNPDQEKPAVSFPLSLHNEVHAHIRAWLLGQLAARLGDTATCTRWAEALAELPVPAAFATPVERLTRSLDAQVHLIQDRPAEALRALAGARTDVWYQHATASPLFCGAFDRMLRARILEDAGREAEALGWYRSLSQRSPWELPFAAPAALRSAAIHEQRGERAEATRCYRQAARWWRDCEPESFKIERDRADKRAAALA